MYIYGHQRYRCPIRRKPSQANMPMDAGPQPIMRIGDIPMLHRIEMNVITISIQFALARNLVFPETTLPYAQLTVAFTTCR